MLSIFLPDSKGSGIKPWTVYPGDSSPAQHWGSPRRRGPVAQCGLLVARSSSAGAGPHPAPHDALRPPHQDPRLSTISIDPEWWCTPRRGPRSAQHRTSRGSTRNRSDGRARTPGRRAVGEIRSYWERFPRRAAHRGSPASAHTANRAERRRSRAEGLAAFCLLECPRTRPPSCSPHVGRGRFGAGRIR